MAPLHCDKFTGDERELLLRIARESIVCGCAQAQFVANDELIRHALSNGNLTGTGNSFVTLTKEGGLRGCIGSVEARDPLPLDVARNAFNSAFRDPRFPALAAGELKEIIIEIAVLSPQQVIPVGTEADLLSELTPHVDGLTIEDDQYRATFLPKVWESLPHPHKFLAALKIKAGMRPDYWSPNIKAYRYHAESFSESAEVGS